MNLLKTLRRWVPGEGDAADEQTVQYEIQYMTHRGGWINPYPKPFGMTEESRPEDDDNDWIMMEGRYRHIRRVDGRIDEVLWTYETTGADQKYENDRQKEQREQKRERQREQLAEMSFQEVRDEFYGETDQLDLLDFDEIRARFETLKEQHRDEQESETEDLTPEERRQARILQAQLQAIQDNLDEMDMEDIFD